MRNLLLALLAAASVPGPAAADPLAAHAWRHRVLLFYAPTGETAALERFRERVAERRCGIDDRDLVIGELVGADGGVLAGRRLDAAAVGALRSRHEIPAEAVATVLVGKDGGTKMRVDGVADLGAVFTRIDGMPMRRQEMETRGPPDCD